MTTELQPFYVRHPNDCFIDEVRIVTRERYKTSDLSGDEWRFHRVIELYRKGMLVAERAFNGTTEQVAAFLPLTMVEICENLITLPDDSALCCQPGCAEKAISEYEIIETFGPQGQRLHPEEQGHWSQRRKFCRKHLRRGDCSREDCDANYRVLSGPGPDGADWRGANVTESRRVDVDVQIDSPEQIGEVVAQVAATLRREKSL